SAPPSWAVPSTDPGDRHEKVFERCSGVARSPQVIWLAIGFFVGVAIGFLVGAIQDLGMDP
ncbi:hypothetical protein, partial [Stenotrophomonas maltophilia]|uniref:hypothetical protein n=1 Tax=Stenotrophomonas maltophilia TaxID=40324 RepID=UPI0019548901